MTATAPMTVRRTQGVCPHCMERVPAAVMSHQGSCHLVKQCPTHGETRQLLSRDAAYWTELDRYYFQVNGERYPQRDYIVRMTERCNMDCPICLAKANTQDTPDLDLSGLEKLLSGRRRVKVDFMAAEPTLREDLEDWIRTVKDRGHIAALHTNGLKLANPSYAQRIKDAGVDEVFVQFDGFDEQAHKVLRGRPLVKARMAAMDNLRALDMATSLIVVIGRGLNEDQIHETLRFALEPRNDHIREVFFMGLRLLGSAREALVTQAPDNPLGKADELAMMPDELIALLCAQEPDIDRDDIRRFNKLYFALLSAFRVKKCLYVQHYLVHRDNRGGFEPVRDWLDLAALEPALDRYAQSVRAHPRRAKAALLAAVTRAATRPAALKHLLEMVQLQALLRSGMNLSDVPRSTLLLGFITACDPANYDAMVSVNCGKGELSVDGGFVESGADANVEREARFEQDARPVRTP